MSNPWMKFYPSDWRSDPRLRICSLAARGLWMEMLAIMHEATPYGHLLISGIPPTDAQLAVLAGAPSDQIPELIGELETAGVFSRTRSGAIYSRRMTRDFKKSEKNRKNGKLGGNPILCNERDNPPPLNPTDNGGVKTQKPEARSQKRVGSNEPTAAGHLAAIIGEDLAKDFIAHRKALKKPMTPRAGKILAEKLASMTDPGAAVLTAIERGWLSAFEVSPHPNVTNMTRHRGPSYAERLDAAFDNLTARLAVQPFPTRD